MASGCLFYYITDRTAFPGDEPSRRRRLLQKISEAACAGVDYVQLREKDLPPRELESIACEAVRALRESTQQRTALLINSRTEVALAVGADGVHLRSDDISPQEVRKVWRRACGAGAHSAGSGQSPAGANSPRDPVIAVSCHSPAEVAQAAGSAANFAVFAPVFEKKNLPITTGLFALRQACESDIPVLALGGVTLANTHACLEAGAAGIAAIRLFQENDIAEVTQRLRHS